MSSGRVIVVESERFGEAGAEFVADELAAAIAARGRAAVALAGGSTPRPVYENLARRDDVDWTCVDVYFGDERAVSPDDPESNYRMAREMLLAHVPVPPLRIHRMEAERADREGAARDYERLLPDALDLVLLGIGEDGHTASLFPGSAALGERERRVVPVVGPKPPPRRLTITPAALAVARGTLVMAAGDAKARAVARALEGLLDTAACPAQLVRGGTWLLDRAAASMLRER